MLALLRQGPSEPQAFWGGFLEGVCILFQARRGFVMVRDAADQSWQGVHTWPPNCETDDASTALASRAQDMASAALEYDYLAADLMGSKSQKKSGTMVAKRLDIAEGQPDSVLALLVDSQSPRAMADLEIYLKLIAQIPGIYQITRSLEQAKGDVVQFADILEFMMVLNQEKRFMAAAMGFCNELASRHGCARVSLGWLEDGYIKVQAISHTEKFDPKMAVVQALEMVMEECHDQNEEIPWPQEELGETLARDHGIFSREQGVPYLLSVPLRDDTTPEGIMVCERVDRPFNEQEIKAFRIICDLVTRRLSELKFNDLWFGARLATQAKDFMSRFFTAEHTLAKVVAVAVFLVVMYGVTAQRDYRVEGNFILKSDDLVYLPAPFDGYIQEVFVNVGDVTQKGGHLLTMDTTELLLERESVRSDISRFQREMEKARARNQLADMKIAQAQMAQSLITMQRIGYRLSNAAINSPFAGIVVEGDLRQKQGAPVRKGDILFKISKLDRMYLEIDIDERDIHEIGLEATGQVSFVSRPTERFDFKVVAIEPAAVPKEGGNIFRIRAATDAQAIPEWWRPGMTGLARVEVGRRNVLWILTHRTVDFIRMNLWW